MTENNDQKDFVKIDTDGDSKIDNLKEVVVISICFIIFAIGVAFLVDYYTNDVDLKDDKLLLQFYKYKLTLKLVIEILSIVLAAFISFVVYTTWRLNKIGKFQETISNDMKLLHYRFSDMQARDNIIAPEGRDYRIISVNTIRRIPSAIRNVWFETVCNSNLDKKYDAGRMYGYSALFWPSVDDMINTHEYVKYMFSIGEETLHRVLFTPCPVKGPGHLEGLEIYRELCRAANVRLHIVNVDSWSKWLATGLDALVKSKSNVDRLLIRDMIQLLHGHFEFWTYSDFNPRCIEPANDQVGAAKTEDVNSSPVAAVRTRISAPFISGQPWYARWIGTSGGDFAIDGRADLSATGRELEERHSYGDVTEQERAAIYAAAGLLETLVNNTRNASEAEASDERVDGYFDASIKPEIKNYLKSLTFAGVLGAEVAASPMQKVIAGARSKFGLPPKPSPK